MYRGQFYKDDTQEISSEPISWRDCRKANSEGNIQSVIEELEFLERRCMKFPHIGENFLLLGVL